MQSGFEMSHCPKTVQLASHTGQCAIAKATTDGRVSLNPMSYHPVRRFGTPEEVADAVLWLCSPGADFITGVALPVDGGFTV